MTSRNDANSLIDNISYLMLSISFGGHTIADGHAHMAGIHPCKRRVSPLPSVPLVVATRRSMPL
jgi:hypothetical protein